MRGRRHDGAGSSDRRNRRVIGEEDLRVRADAVHARLCVADGQRQITTQHKADEVLGLHRHDDGEAVVI